MTVFAERGFYNAKVSEVADAAGVAGGTIYLYFKNKDDLLISVFEDRMEAILSYLRASLAQIDSVVERLRTFIDLHFKMVSENPALAEVLTVELRQSSKFMREYTPRKFGEYLGLLESLYVEGCEKGVFRTGIDAKVFKRALFGALDEVSTTWVSARREGVDGPFELENAAQDIFSIFVDGVIAPSTKTEDRSSK